MASDDVKLGKLQDEFAVPRDAIHVAVFLAVAGEKLGVGEDVCLAYGTNNVVLSAIGKDYAGGSRGPAIGIVDPFIRFSLDARRWRIEQGERVYVLLYPGTVTGMRHQWKHPLFDAPLPNVSESERWLREFADRWNFNYDELIREASSTTQEKWGHYITAQGVDLHSRDELGFDHDLFWKHLEAMTGKTFDLDHRERFGWSCSC